MTGVTTGQTSLPTATGSDVVRDYATGALVTALQTLANLFESATGHDHSGAGKGAAIGSAGIASGVTLTNPVLNGTLTGTGGLNAWTAFTPTVTQSGSVTVTVTSARYSQIGKTAFVQVELAITGSGTAGNSIDVTLTGAPAPRLNGTAPNGLAGTGLVFDSSVATFYGGGAAFAGASLVRIYQGGSAGAIGQAPSFGLGSGDAIALSLNYEVA